MFFGGAARGGKSIALLMGALQYVDVPGYSALILREQLSDLKLAGALIEVARDWLSASDARENRSEHIWTFPSGATLQFGYLARDDQVTRYRSSEFQYVAFDEVTTVSLFRYRTMFSRLSRPALPCLRCGWSLARFDGEWFHEPRIELRPNENGEMIEHVVMPPTEDCLPDIDEAYVKSLGAAPDGLILYDVPLRMRSASNPGGKGHAWVKARFIDSRTRHLTAVYLPSRLEDNDYVDQGSYERNLYETDAVNFSRLRFGDWEVRDPGSIFDRRNVVVVNERYNDYDTAIDRVRFWDLASTEVSEGNDPDYTSGALLARNGDDGTIRLEHLAHARLSPAATLDLIAQTAQSDGYDVPIVIEQEPGASGKLLIDQMARTTLAGYSVEGVVPTGKKELRIRVLVPMVERKQMQVVSGQWNADFLDELDGYPMAVLHDDQVDSVAGAFAYLVSARRARIIV